MRSKKIARSSRMDDVNFDDLQVYSVRTTKGGKLRDVLEYVDGRTGEIIPASELAITALDLREKHKARAAALKSLRKEPRQFAEFVLKFANKRRGITPGIDKLCHWYATLKDKRADNVRRYIPELQQAGVLFGDALLGPLFQRTGSRARECLGEESQAHSIFLTMLWRKEALPLTARGNQVPAELVAEEVARAERERATESTNWAAHLAELAIAKAQRGATAEHVAA